MKQENTKDLILEKALDLFSKRGYDAVSVDDIAKAVGIKAPSLYNHFGGKKEIFDGIVTRVCELYDRDTDKINIHVNTAEKDVNMLKNISENALFELLKSIFCYSLHNETISKFRKMLCIEQFRSPEISALYTERYVDRIVFYHASIFKELINSGEIKNEDPETLATLYVSPVIVLLGICDRSPEKENECIGKLKKHVNLFYCEFNTKKSKI